MVDCPSCGAKAGQKCEGDTYCPERWEIAEKVARIPEKEPDLRKSVSPETRRFRKGSEPRRFPYPLSISKNTEGQVSRQSRPDSAKSGAYFS
jgi:hypothetical protein